MRLHPWNLERGPTATELRQRVLAQLNGEAPDHRSVPVVLVDGPLEGKTYRMPPSEWWRILNQPAMGGVLQYRNTGRYDVEGRLMFELHSNGRNDGKAEA